jgi:ABC-2 type transport system ATP-binding protein
VFLDEPTAALDPEAAFVVRDAIEQLRRAGRTIVLATHNLDEADRLCDRIAFVRGGLLRVDSPARLRGDHARPRLTVRLADGVGATPAILAAVAGVSGVQDTSAVDGRLDVTADDPAAVAPAVVRALVAAEADIVEVSVARTSLEDVYFEVMGVRPEAGGAF